MKEISGVLLKKIYLVCSSERDFWCAAQKYISGLLLRRDFECAALKEISGVLLRKIYLLCSSKKSDVLLRNM